MAWRGERFYYSALAWRDRGAERYATALSSAVAKFSLLLEFKQCGLRFHEFFVLLKTSRVQT